MDSKFHLKRNVNKQLSKLTKENIIILDLEFSKESIKTNRISILREIDDNFLSDFFQNFKFPL